MFAAHLKVSAKQSPANEKEEVEMKYVPYSSTIGSLMYVMICTGLDIAYEMSVVSRFLTNLGKEHWSAVKWILRYLIMIS